jgi:hypothetical protein
MVNGVLVLVVDPLRFCLVDTLYPWASLYLLPWKSTIMKRRNHSLGPRDTTRVKPHRMMSKKDQRMVHPILFLTRLLEGSFPDHLLVLCQRMKRRENLNPAPAELVSLALAPPAPGLSPCQKVLDGLPSLFLIPHSTLILAVERAVMVSCSPPLLDVTSRYRSRNP